MNELKESSLPLASREDSIELASTPLGKLSNALDEARNARMIQSFYSHSSPEIERACSTPRNNKQYLDIAVKSGYGGTKKTLKASRNKTI
jgi:hypothetical protein